MAQSKTIRRLSRHLVLAPLLLAALTTLASAQIQLAPQGLATADIAGETRLAQTPPEAAAPAPAPAEPRKPRRPISPSSTA